MAIDGPNSYDPGRPVGLHACLRGRVAWVNAVNPRLGERLRQLLDTINWDALRACRNQPFGSETQRGCGWRTRRSKAMEDARESSFRLTLV